MVGTNATRLPRPRRANEAARTSSSCAVQRAREGAALLTTIALVVARARTALLALHAVAAHGEHALRREAEVPHDRDARLRDGAHGLGAARAALELDRVGAALLHQAPGVLERVARAGLVAQERQVGHDQRARPG